MCLYDVTDVVGLWTDKVLTDMEMKATNSDSMRDLKLVLYSAVSLSFLNLSDIVFSMIRQYQLF